MQEKQSHAHGGHRARLKARFVREGLSSFEDHNALELLLFYAIPQRDTNELAHRLISEFGSLSGVLDASVEALMRVDGVGENTAVLLHMLPGMFAKYEQDKVRTDALVLNSAQKAGEYLVSLFVGKTTETFIAVCMNHKCKVTNTVILAHNHPAGVAAPSAADIEATRHIIMTLRSLGITVNDHFIVAGKDWFSMATNSKLKRMFGA